MKFGYRSREKITGKAESRRTERERSNYFGSDFQKERVKGRIRSVRAECLCFKTINMLLICSYFQ